MIVIIPFNVPWNWSTDYLNQTAFELAKKGHIVVCYLLGDTVYLKDLFKKKRSKLFLRQSDNVYLITPLFFIPFRRFKFIENLNSGFNLIVLRILSEVISYYRQCTRKIFWIFDPNLSFVYKFFGNNYYLIYDCVDFFAVGTKDFIARTSKNEKYLTQKADLAIANSTVLQKHLQKYRKYIPLVPQGFRIDSYKISKKKFIDLKIKRPVIGFVGGINKRLDLSIIYPLVKNNPGWNFVFWGPIQMQDAIEAGYWRKLQSVLRMPNVKTGLSNDKNEIPGVISQFDICIIPYDISQDFNKYCYPMKLFEYFYLGKPVVSTGIIELKRFPDLVKLCTTYKQWEDAIDYLIKHPLNPDLLAKEKQFAIDNSWKEKVGQIVDMVLCRE